MKVGLGYDVHKLVEGRDLILGGVNIPYERGLLGHSDADVLIHSIMDSILGALGEGDIGRHFPDTDMEYKDISSMVLLARVKDILDKTPYKISNIDTSICAQEPKLAGYIDPMLDNISRVLGISKNSLNIKATTTEGLGFVGNKEGISAYSICLLLEK